MTHSFPEGDSPAEDEAAQAARVSREAREIPRRANRAGPLKLCRRIRRSCAFIGPNGQRGRTGRGLPLSIGITGQAAEVGDSLKKAFGARRRFDFGRVFFPALGAWKPILFITPKHQPFKPVSAGFALKFKIGHMDTPL